MLPENLVTNFLSGFQHRSKYGKDPTAGGKARTVQGCKVPQSCATLFPTLLSSPVASYVGPCLLAPTTTTTPAIRQANVLAWGQEAKKSPLHFYKENATRVFLSSPQFARVVFRSTALFSSPGSRHPYCMGQEVAKSPSVLLREET